MSIKINGTEITFDIYDTIASSSAEWRAEIADALSLHDDIRKNVIDSLLLGTTEMRSSNTFDGMIEDRKRVIDGLQEIKDDQIAALECNLSIATKRLKAAEDAHRRVVALCYAATDNGHTLVRMMDVKAALDLDR